MKIGIESHEIEMYVRQNALKLLPIEPAQSYLQYFSYFLRSESIMIK